MRAESAHFETAEEHDEHTPVGVEDLYPDDDRKDV